LHSKFKCQNNNGSCLLLLILISSVIFIYAINALQNSFFSLSIARQKFETEYNFRNLESLHNYGLFLYFNNVKHNFKKGNAKPIVLYKDHWPLKSKKTWPALITLTKENDIEIIKSQMNNAYIENKIKNIPNDSKKILYDWKYVKY